MKDRDVVLLLFAYHLLLITVGAWFSLRLSNEFGLRVAPVLINVAFLGLCGGCTYCIRSLYIQYCVKGEWNNRWVIWHIVRPSVSTICGIVSLLFVKAGLLIFEASATTEQSHYGIYALAFIAGLNVDNFMKKIESVFAEVMGIGKSNLSKMKSNSKEGSSNEHN